MPFGLSELVHDYLAGKSSLCLQYRSSWSCLMEWIPNIYIDQDERDWTSNSHIEIKNTLCTLQGLMMSAKSLDTAVVIRHSGYLKTLAVAGMAF